MRSQSTLARWNRLGGVLDRVWFDGRSRGAAAQLHLLQECLGSLAVFKAFCPPVSKPINIVGEVFAATIVSNPISDGHGGQRNTTDTDSEEQEAPTHGVI